MLTLRILNDEFLLFPPSPRSAPLLLVGYVGSVCADPPSDIQWGGWANQDGGGENPDRSSRRARRHCHDPGKKCVWLAGSAARLLPLLRGLISVSCPSQGLTLDPPSQTANLQMMVMSLGLPAAPIIKPLSEHFTLVSPQSRGVGLVLGVVLEFVKCPRTCYLGGFWGFCR